MDRYREILLRTFRAFSDLCSREGLRWWLAFGSAIGAARQGGILPWDDDVDVFMPREDYERFLRLSVEGYRIADIRSFEGDLPFAYAKFMDGGSRIQEQRRYPVEIGVFIDVFPLDAAGPDPEPLRRAYRSALLDYVRSFRLHFLGEWLGDVVHGRLHDAGAAVQDLLWYRPRKRRLRERFLAVYAQAASQPPTGAYAVWCTNSEYGGVTFPAEWFSSTVLVPFEGGVAPLPAGNDSLLTLLYGDWRTPPPASERRSVHRHYRMDLG